MDKNFAKTSNGLLKLVFSGIFITSSALAQEAGDAKLPDFQILGYKTCVLSPIGDYCPVILQILIRNNGEIEGELPKVGVKGKSPTGKDLNLVWGDETDWYDYDSRSWSAVRVRYQFTNVHKKQILAPKESAFVQKEIGLLEKGQDYEAEFEAVVDSKDKITESDETNNKIKFSIKIVGSKAPEVFRPIWQSSWVEKQQAKPIEAVKLPASPTPPTTPSAPPEPTSPPSVKP